MSFEALTIPTIVDILSSRIAGKYYDTMIYPVIDTVLRPIKDDLLSMFSSFDDITQAVIEKAWSIISPVSQMADDLGAQRLISKFEAFMDGMIEHYLVKNKMTKKLLTDVAYIFQIEPRNVYKLSKTSLEGYITQLFENAPDSTEMMTFYQGLSYEDWANHKLVMKGLRKFAAKFTKFITVMENRAVQRGFVCPKKAVEMINSGEVTFELHSTGKKDHKEGDKKVRKIAGGGKGRLFCCNYSVAHV
jgi:hypothetical protein